MVCSPLDLVLVCDDDDDDDDSTLHRRPSLLTRVVWLGCRRRRHHQHHHQQQQRHLCTFVLFGAVHPSAKERHSVDGPSANIYVYVACCAVSEAFPDVSLRLVLSPLFASLVNAREKYVYDMWYI